MQDGSWSEFSWLGRALVAPVDNVVKNQTEHRPLLDIDQAAAYLGLKPRRVYTLEERGLLPVVRIGRSVLFDPNELDRFIDEHRSR